MLPDDFHRIFAIIRIDIASQTEGCPVALKMWPTIYVFLVKGAEILHNTHGMR
jgi:hypothetical protein